MIKKVNIRKVASDDLESVYKMVEELAIYEKEPEAVTSDINDYKSAFESGLIDVIVADYMNEIIGIALFYETFSTWKGKMLYLEDFIVKQSFRGKGIGQLIFEQFIVEAKSRKCNLVKWEVLDWNEPAINFYKKYGTTFKTDWTNCLIYF